MTTLEDYCREDIAVRRARACLTWARHDDSPADKAAVVALAVAELRRWAR